MHSVMGCLFFYIRPHRTCLFRQKFIFYHFLPQLINWHFQINFAELFPFPSPPADRVGNQGL